MTSMIRIPLRGDELARETADKIRQRNIENDEKVRRMGVVPREPKRIKVQVARPDLRVPDAMGNLYPNGTFEVDPSDIYVSRRLMEGSLVQVETSSGGAQPEAEPAPEVEPEPVPEPATEPTPAE